MILNELQQEGQNVRKVYQRRLPSDPSKDYYFIHRNTGITEPVIVEYGFLDSNLDDVGQLKNDYERYSNAVVRAVLKYIGYENIDGNTYIVKSGDSLWSISKKFNTTVDELKRLNNLTSNLLSVGQLLMIPNNELESDENVYIVKSGDSLYSIGRRYNISVNTLKEYNNLTSDLLSVGQVIRIPNNEQSSIISDDIYIVKPGDSLYSIAKNYNLSVDDLINYNNLTSTILNVNQQIKIPSGMSSFNDYLIYTVKSGDNLYSISKKYNVSVAELMSYNNLSTNLLSINQQIKIPLVNNSITYTVKSGDNLYNIARTYNTTVDEIKRKNNLTSNNLKIGQILVI